MTTNLFFVTDVSAQTGLGHFMRCFAIAEEAGERGLRVFFLLPEPNDYVNERAASIGATCLRLGKWSAPQIQQTLNDGGCRSSDWVVIDSYRTSTELLKTLHAEHRLLLMDDLCALSSYANCHVVVNAAPGAERLPYKNKGLTATLLAGPSFAQIRRDFVQCQIVPSTTPSVVIVMGGSDPAELTLPCVQKIRAQLPNLRLEVVVGPANPRGAEVAKALENDRNTFVHFSPKNLPQLLSQSTLVVTAGGGSIGEVCALGKPAVVLLVADNQMRGGEAGPYPTLDARQGVTEGFADMIEKLMDNEKEREQIASTAKQAVDGKGCARIVSCILKAHHHV